MLYERKPKRYRGACVGFTFLLTLMVAASVLFYAEQCFPGAGRAFLRAGVPFPRTLLPDLNGEKLVLPDNAGGKAAIIHFTRIWCGECEDEMAVMQRIQALHGEKGVAFYWVNVGEASEPGRAFASKTKTGYPVLFDPGAMVTKQHGDLNGSVTLVCDGSGIIRGRLMGGMSQGGLEKLLRLVQMGI